ncbi:OmpA family protein [Celeribacter sp.]|uniref:OmpA family protein n=1 Tax=Celeribacter sp. TaxID=1890673 RepID=UPI003A92985A
MRLSSFVPTVVAFVLAAAMSLVGANFSTRAIETVSQNAVQEKLAVEGFNWVEVQTDGLQVVLSGTAPDESTQLAAQRAAGHVVDPARVINVMDMEARESIGAPRFSMEILRNDHGISLIGLVPTQWDREAFIRSVEKAASTGAVADLLEQADYPIPPAWEDVAEFGLEAIERLPRSKISLAADGIDVTALADSKEQKARLERALHEMSPNGIDVTIDVAAPRPVITPFTVRFLIDEEGARFDACSVETPEGHARLIAAARALGVSDPSCVIGLGAPTDDWAAIVEGAMRAVAELGTGTVTFSDGEVSLIGTAGTSTVLFDKVAGELEADLPDSFTLHARLPEPETDEAEEAPQFLAIRSPEGQVQLRGRIPDDRTQTATEAYAKAAFGANTVYSALRQDTDLPQGWSIRALAAIEALAQLQNGSVTMKEDHVRIRGRTGDPDGKALITRLLAEKLGSGSEFDIEVEYVRKLDPVLDLPEPQECVDRANAVIQSAKIVFPPGSTDVDASSTDTLDRLAKAFENCENMEIEIGAHSDSQGREEMNLQLSQARANSVLNALIARRVVSVDFTAVGYGEAHPIATNETEEGREANRRIEFKLAGAAETTDEAADDNGDEADATEATSETEETDDAAMTDDASDDAAADEEQSDEATDAPAETDTDAEATDEGETE